VADQCSVPDKAHLGSLHEHDIRISRTQSGKIILCKKHEQAYRFRFDPSTGQKSVRQARRDEDCVCRICVKARRVAVSSW
jgi:hypothetical protein